MNEKTIDQIEEVLICEISDEAVEAAGRAEIAGGVDVCLHRYSVRSPVCTQAMNVRSSPIATEVLAYVPLPFPSLSFSRRANCFACSIFTSRRNRSNSFRPQVQHAAPTSR